MGQVIYRTGMEGKTMSPTMPGPDIIAARRMLLRLHGLTVGGASLEEAAVNWRDAAHASLSSEGGA